MKIQKTLLLVFSLLFLSIFDAAANNNYIEGEVLVRYKTNATFRVSRTQTKQRKIRLLSHTKKRQVGLLKSETETTAELMKIMSADPNVDKVAPNYIRELYSITPNDKHYTNLWAFHNTGQTFNNTNGTPDVDMDFPEAWSLSKCVNEREVVVAVLDTGVDYRHPDLADNMWTNRWEIPGNGVDDDNNNYVDDVYGYDFAGDGSSEPDNDPMDTMNHGTHVAGTIAAVGNNDIGVIGIHPTAKIMALKISNDGSIPDSASLAAIEYVLAMKAKGVNVVAINASYGGNNSSAVMEAAIVDAGNAGIVLCAAAGNDSMNGDIGPIYPASFSASNIISVAAHDLTGKLASFSGYGSNSVDLAAPGVEILSAVPLNNSTGYVKNASQTWYANGLEYSGLTKGITGTVYHCGQGNSNEFPVAVSGNIALIQRGTITFRQKIENAMSAGAIAAIIYNNVEPGSFTGTLDSPANWIPSISITKGDGEAIQALGNVQLTILLTANYESSYGYLEGTSMATPHVSGAIAFLALNYPNDTAFERVARVLDNVDVASELAGKVKTSGRLNLWKAMDTDNDTLPDWWELETTNTLQVMNGSTDTDSDGMSDLQEWTAGTAAGDSNSVLKLSIINRDKIFSENLLTLSWPSTNGRKYSVISGTNLTLSALATNINAVPPTNTYTNNLISSVTNSFYAVRIDAINCLNPGQE